MIWHSLKRPCNFLGAQTQGLTKNGIVVASSLGLKADFTNPHLLTTPPRPPWPSVSVGISVVRKNR